jgi:hypothetical protein
MVRVYLIPFFQNEGPIDKLHGLVDPLTAPREQAAIKMYLFQAGIVEKSSELIHQPVIQSINVFILHTVD